MNALGAVFFAVAMLALGWFGRGWWDGSDISTADSADASQVFVTSGVEADRNITSAQDNADAANERVREVIRKVYVDRACPPGVGAVSQPIAASLRTAFAEGDTASR